jgi:methyltransferase (TIGR00027 family)
MLLSDISDTARWMAYARAIESDRPDALFQDALARPLAGKAGEAIARKIGHAEFIARSIAVRTAVTDELILQTIRDQQVDLVLDIAAGLDSRPWRLTLPPKLQWLDVDLPDILEYKASIVGHRAATCRYEQLPADVARANERARVLDRCSGALCGLVVTEGFLVYLRPERVAALARDLYEQASLKWWLTDIMGPRALATLQRLFGPLFSDVKFQFGPRDSTRFFQRLGWREALFRSSQEEAKRLNRGAPMSLLSRILLCLSSPSFREEFRRLSGVALLERDDVQT